MNDFYSIVEEHSKKVSTYQLENLGPHREMSFGSVKKDGYGGTQVNRQSILSKTTPADYDSAFAFRISRIKPPYELEKFLDFHLHHYENVHEGKMEKFALHMKYVIAPLLKSRDNSNLYTELLNLWINKKTMDHKNQFGNTSIAGNGNIVNIAAGNIHQEGVFSNADQSSYDKLKDFGVDETQISKLKKIIEDNKENTPSLMSKALNWVAEVGKSLAVKGLTENLPQITEYIGQIIHPL